MLKRTLDRNQNLVPLAVLFSIAVAIGLLSRGWLYTPIGLLDPWYNVGHFLHYFDGVFWPGHYKESRLSWILPGYLLYRLFGSSAGNFVLHVGAVFVACSFVYLILARAIPRTGALFAACLLMAYYPLHSQLDYQTIGSAAYHAVAVYLVLRAAEATEPRNLMILAGIAFGASFHANIIVVNMVPALAALFIMLSPRRQSLRDILIAAGWALLGFVLLTIGLCFVAWLAGRPVLFFWPIVEIVFRYTADTATMKAWWRPWSSLWILEPAAASYLLVGSLVFLGSIGWLVAEFFRPSAAGSSDDRSKNQLKVWLVAQFVFLAILWIIWQSLGHVALQPDYFAFPLIIPAFLALGVFCEGAGRKALIALAIIALGTLLFTQPFGKFFLGSWISQPTVASKIAASIGLCALLVGALAPKLRDIAILVTTYSFLLLFQFVVATTQIITAAQTWSEPGWFLSQRRCVEPEAAFQQIVRLNNIFRQRNPVWWQTWVWVGPYEEHRIGNCTFPLSDFRGSLISTGTSGLGAPSDKSADGITDEFIGFVVPSGQVVAITRDESYAKQLVERFARSGKKLEFVTKENVKIGQVDFDVYIYKNAS